MESVTQRMQLFFNNPWKQKNKHGFDTIKVGANVRFKYNDKERWGVVESNKNKVLTIKNDFGFKSYSYKKIENIQIGD